MSSKRDHERDAFVAMQAANTAISRLGAERDELFSRLAEAERLLDAARELAAGYRDAACAAGACLAEESALPWEAE